MKICVDLESDGLLDTVTKIHCISVGIIKEEELSEVFTYFTLSEELLTLLSEAEEVIGHNFIGYDLQVLEKFSNKKLDNIVSKVYDTFLTSQFLNLKGKLKLKKLSLESWAEYLQCERKVAINDWSGDSLSYKERCESDVRITFELYKFIKKQESFDITTTRKIENNFCNLLSKQEQYGIAFDVEKAEGYLVAVKEEIEKMFNQFKESYSLNLCFGNSVGSININSPKQVNKVLDEAGEKREEVLKVILGIRSMVAKTKQLKSLLEAQKDGVIHGGGVSCGAVTGRVRHTVVVNINKDRGIVDARALFKARQGKVLVGGDLSAIEAMLVANYMEEGVLKSLVYNGRFHDDVLVELKEFCQSLTRDDVKTLNYGCLYGASEKKITEIFPALGQEGINKLLSIWQPVQDLIHKLQRDVQARGGGKVISYINKKGKVTKYLNVNDKASVKLLDGREVPLEQGYMILNYLIQGTAAILFKLLAIYVQKEIDRLNINAKLVLNFHDELNYECEQEQAEVLKNVLKDSLTRAAKSLLIKAPVSIDVKIGENWGSIH